MEGEENEKQAQNRALGNTLYGQEMSDTDLRVVRQVGETRKQSHSQKCRNIKEEEEDEKGHPVQHLRSLVIQDWEISAELRVRSLALRSEWMVETVEIILHLLLGDMDSFETSLSPSGPQFTHLQNEGTR